MPLPEPGKLWWSVSWCFDAVCNKEIEKLGKIWHSIVEFLSDVRSELKKTSYPTKTETIGSTTVVLLFSVIMSLYLSMVDSFLVWLISRII
ncbi:MAG: preprotein translocase subunit SecE [Nitrospirales bacterium]|nr:preprotein translocase subunit SecE [Nitrospirales bacterium]